MSTKTQTAGVPDKALQALKYVWREHSIIIALVAMIIVASIIAPRFGTPQNILLILRKASVIGMIALGMTFVIITGGIDLSAGHLVATTGTVLILMLRIPTMPIIGAVLIALAAGTLVGTVNGLIITKFQLPAFIVTLAVGTIARSLTTFYLQGLSVSVGRDRPMPEFQAVGNGWIGPLPTPLVIWGVFAIILGCVLAYTKYGSYTYAVGGNENAARYSGISTNKIKIMAYALTGFTAGAAAVLSVSRTLAVSAVTTGHLYEFDAITAAVIGGTALAGGRGKVVSTFFGMIIIALVSNLMIMLGISPFLAGTVKGCIILGAVFLQKRDR